MAGKRIRKEPMSKTILQLRGTQSDADNLRQAALDSGVGVSTLIRQLLFKEGVLRP